MRRPLVPRCGCGRGDGTVLFWICCIFAHQKAFFEITSSAWIQLSFKESFISPKLLRLLIMRLHLDFCRKRKVSLQCLKCIFQHRLIHAMIDGIEEAYVSARGANLLSQLFPILQAMRVDSSKVNFGNLVECCRSCFPCQDSPTTRNSAIMVMDPSVWFCEYIRSSHYTVLFSSCR